MPPLPHAATALVKIRLDSRATDAVSPYEQLLVTIYAPCGKTRTFGKDSATDFGPHPITPNYLPMSTCQGSAEYYNGQFRWSPECATGSIFSARGAACFT